MRFNESPPLQYMGTSFWAMMIIIGRITKKIITVLCCTCKTVVYSIRNTYIISSSSWVLVKVLIYFRGFVYVYRVVCFYGLAIDYLVLVLLADVVLVLVPSVLRREIGWEEHLRVWNDILCRVDHETLTQSIWSLISWFSSKRCLHEIVWNK